MPPAKRTGPVAFISSFSKEIGIADGPLVQLRRAIAELNHDTTLRQLLGFGERKLAWVAEYYPEELGSDEDLAIVDCLVRKLQHCDLYVCILADSRRITHATGTAIQHCNRSTRVSFFEIELYAAAMYRKPVFLYVLNGFDASPRLTTVLDLLFWAFPDWRQKTFSSPPEILSDLRELLISHSKTAAEAATDLSAIVGGLYVQRIGPLFSKGKEGPLLFDGVFEVGPLPDREQVKQLIQEYRRAVNYQDKAVRLWMAVRSLMTASYRVADVQRDSRLKAFLPLWDTVLGDWASIASWQRWHGHLYAGTVAPLNSQMIVRSQSQTLPTEFEPEVCLPPDGALASAYYNIAKVAGGIVAVRALHRADRYINKAIHASSGPLDNLLAIRGSIRLRSGRWFGAVADFREMSKLRERCESSPQRIADAYMHLGQAYAVLPMSAKAEDLLSKAVDLLEAFPYDPNLPRARRKLLNYYVRRGNRSRAQDCREKLLEDVTRQGVLDQFPEERTP